LGWVRVLVVGDGVMLLKDIKARAPETVGVILTNYAGAVHRSRYLAARADHFLDSSGGLDRLVEVFGGLAALASDHESG